MSHIIIDGSRHFHSQSKQVIMRCALKVLGDSAAARYKLQRLVSTREQDQASAQAPATLAELAEYADGTAGQVQALQVGDLSAHPSHLEVVSTR